MKNSSKERKILIGIYGTMISSLIIPVIPLVSGAAAAYYYRFLCNDNILQSHYRGIIRTAWATLISSIVPLAMMIYQYAGLSKYNIASAVTDGEYFKYYLFAGMALNAVFAIALPIAVTAWSAMRYTKGLSRLKRGLMFN